METIFTSALIIVGMLMLAAFHFGYRAGRQEEKLVEVHPNLKLIVPEEEKALESDEEIRKDMEKARKLATGYDFSESS